VVTIRIPVPRGLGSNLLGLAGLLAFALAVGGLSGNWWWSVLIGGVFSFGLAVLIQMAPAQAHASAAATAEATQEIPRLATVGRLA
jgi:hypothetical protein